MKKTLYTLLILACTLSAVAQPVGSVLHLRLYNNRNFALRIDGIPFGAADRSQTVTGLQPGYHTLEVTTWIGHGRHARYPVTVFAGQVYVPAMTELTACIERYNNLVILSSYAMMPPPVCPAPYFPVIKPAPAPSLPVCQGPVAVSDYEFQNLRAAIAGRDFESTRLSMTRQLLAERYLNTRQVMSLMQLFDFESNRLEVAKFAFARTIDRNNYYQTFALFDFDSSVRELSRYMESYS
jgi:hypothetical protein